MAPTIRDGDLVVLDAGRAEPLDGQVFVVRTGEGILVKRLRRTDDRWELESDNPRTNTGPLRTGTESSVRWPGRDHRLLNTRRSRRVALPAASGVRSRRQRAGVMQTEGRALFPGRPAACSGWMLVRAGERRNMMRAGSREESR